MLYLERSHWRLQAICQFHRCLWVLSWGQQRVHLLTFLRNLHSLLQHYTIYAYIITYMHIQYHKCIYNTINAYIIPQIHKVIGQIPQCLSLSLTLISIIQQNQLNKQSTLITLMGPNKSSAAKQYCAHTLNHRRMRQARLLRQGQHQYMQISVHVLSQCQVTGWQTHFKPLKEVDPLFLPTGYQYKKMQFCGSGGTCVINYQNYPCLLSDQIADRALSDKEFQNCQMWYLAYTMFQAAEVFHSQGKKVGDVQPGNVFISLNGQAKVGTQYSWPNQMTNYQKTLFQKEITYLAPEEMKDLHFGQPQSRHPPDTSESFSIGLTLLDTVMLSNSKDLYDMGLFRINYLKLEERLQQLARHQEVDYLLSTIIQGLCAVEQHDRLSCRHLYSWLKKYQQSLLNLEQVKFQEVPAWLKVKGRGKGNTQGRGKGPFMTQQQGQEETHQEPFFNLNLQHQQIKLQPSAQLPHLYQPNKPIPTYESHYISQPTTMGSRNAKNDDDFRVTLEKIQEQLAMSRKMFPSQL